MALSTINNWINENQALLDLIALPALTIIVGFIGSYLIHKNKTDEIKLNGRAKLADFRIENFNALMHEVKRLQALIGEVLVQSASDSDHRLTEAQMKALLTSFEDIAVRIRTDNKLIERFRETLGKYISVYGGQRRASSNTIISELRDICHEIIDSEWKQIESELKSLK